jgi:metal-responsive CopG/Arc/MetJ family transcriptional regulator
MISVRLPEEMERKINAISKRDKITKSELIKKALQDYISKIENYKSSYEIGNEFFGLHSIEDTELSTTYKKKLEDQLNQKHSY